MAVKRNSGSSIPFILLLFLYILPLVVIAPGLPAQTQPHHPPKVEGTLFILAVRVEFQPDENRFTSGTGTFDDESLPYLSDPGTNIDPLPHNQAYFEAHLEFAKNYFERQSKNRLNIQYQVLPDIYRVDKPMESYSPTGENPDLYPLAELAADVWEKVGEDGSLPVMNTPQDHIAFVVFHAGVGRDIELTGTTLDKTPQDIPSIYLDSDNFRSLLNDNSFAGFPINNGNLLVDNTLILPRTLSRPGEDITGNRFVLPLSLNGMVTAQIGSHLGLPDLFNTETGESGIGRFGLMDGAGIFSYNGLFPPEMSAWEKIYLGWETPITVNYATSRINLPAGSLRKENSIAKIPVSADEYFLVENRHRDPEGNGVLLTIQNPQGELQEVAFTNSDEVFTSHNLDFDELLPPGVVVDVSNYDFSLPGGLDAGADNTPGTEDDRELNGGILIWHIDEAVIRNTPEMKGINDDPDRRGVSLKEADGARDIGRPASIGISQNEVNGSAFDFWWAGNNASVVTQTDSLSMYQNRFGPDTTPDNKSNSGGASFFELFDFSENLPVAEFNIRPVNPNEDLYRLAASGTLSASVFTPADDDYWQRYPLSMVPFENAGEMWIIIPGNNGVDVYNTTSDSLMNLSTEISALQQPVVDTHLNLFSVAEHPQQSRSPIIVNLFQWVEENPETVWSFSTEPNTGFLSLGENSIIDIDGTPYRADLQNREILYTEEPVQQSDKRGEYQSVIHNNILSLYHPGGSETFNLPPIAGDFRRAHTGLTETSDNEILFYLLTDNRLSIFRPEDDYGREIVLLESGFIEWPAFADFTSDGSPDFLFIDHTTNQVFGKNRNGASLANFPVRPPKNITFIGTPLIADINGDGENNLLVTGQDEFSISLYAYNENAEPIDGFPLYIGGVSDVQNQPVHPLITDKNLFAVSHSGDFKAWELPNLQNIKWGSRYGNNANNKITGEIDTGSAGEIKFSLLNPEETYNWPNPAKDETFIRYQTRIQAEINILITTLSGRTLYNRTLRSDGGVPEEIRIDTSGWASGGYFALISAKADGQTERKLVKIAIAK